MFKDFCTIEPIFSLQPYCSQNLCHSVTHNSQNPHKKEEVVKNILKILGNFSITCMFTQIVVLTKPKKYLELFKH